MKHIFSYPFASLLLLLLSGLLASCEYKDLCYDHYHYVNVRVVFDWHNVPDAAPDGMLVYFYSVDDPSGERVRYDLPGRDGGIVRLLPGTYRAVAYNYFSESILFRGYETIPGLEAYTRQSSLEEGTRFSTRTDYVPRSVSTADQPVILEPTALWAAASEEFTLELPERVTFDSIRAGAGESETETRTVVLTPDTRTADVTVTVHNVPDQVFENQFAGALGGLSPSVWVASGRKGDGLATQAFSLSPVGGARLRGTFRIFGHCPDSGVDAEGGTHEHILTVYAVLADGTKWYYDFDVTGQMHDALKNPDPLRIFIDVDGLPVPKPIVNGGGFHPDVDGWSHEVVYLSM